MNINNKVKGVIYAATSGIGTLVNVYCYNKAVSLWKEEENK